jgi:hypothetical protein
VAKPRGDDLVRSLYKATLSCADHQDPEFARALHISTPLDDAIVLAAQKKKVVIITGNPGDGKTHLIRHIRKDLSGRVEVNEDANQYDDADLTRAIDKAVAARMPLVVAINEGVLLNVCERAKAKFAWARPIRDLILKPYVYDADEIRGHDQIVMLDLNLRNNLAPNTVQQALKKVAALADAVGPLADNAQRLTNPTTLKRVTDLLDAVGKTGFHATMRDLLGFLAYLVAGADQDDPEEVRPYFVNAFDGGVGPLFERVREFDPVLSPAPFLDDQLFMAEDRPEEWAYQPPDETRISGDLDSFNRRKRRAYFEHIRGGAILRSERDDIARHFGQLRRVDQSPEQVAIRLLNRFFESKDGDTANLVLWFSHQYSAKAVRYVVSRQAVPAFELEIKVPRLPDSLSDAFKDHYPDHVILRHKQMPLNDGLVIDRRLVSMLVTGDRYAGTGSRSLEAFTKIAAFYDRLARRANGAQAIVQILRLDNMTKTRIGVNVADAVYYVPGG